jgi:hypothetical protein
MATRRDQAVAVMQFPSGMHAGAFTALPMEEVDIKRMRGSGRNWGCISRMAKRRPHSFPRSRNWSMWHLNGIVWLLVSFPPKPPGTSRLTSTGDCRPSPRNHQEPTAAWRSTSACACFLPAPAFPTAPHTSSDKGCAILGLLHIGMMQGPHHLRGRV